MTKDLIKLLLRIYSLNLLIIHPIQDEIGETLKSILGENFRELTKEELEKTIQNF